jgi:hypothetical protein
MIDRLYDPVDLTMTLNWTGLASAAFLLGPWLGARLGWTALDKHLDHVAPAQTTISSMAAVILSFPLIPPYGNLRSTQEIIDREASQIDVLDWVLLQHGEAGRNCAHSCGPMRPRS